MPYVYSTLTADNKYAHYVKAGDQQHVEREVLIHGGHGVANRNLITPRGVVTKVTDDELEFLEANSAFKFHRDNGFLSVEQKEFDTEAVASNMEGRDGSSPIVPSDYEAGGMMDVGAPSVGAEVKTKPKK